MERSLHVVGVITASEPHRIAPFSGLQPRDFRRLIAMLRREGAELTRRGPQCCDPIGSPGWTIKARMTSGWPSHRMLSAMDLYAFASPARAVG